jgi:hypothetical protein
MALGTVTAQMMQHTPLSGSGLSIPTDNKQREFAVWVEAKRLRNTQFTDWMSRSDEDYGDTGWDIEIGQSYEPQITTTLTASAGASDENLTVATTALLRPGDVLKAEQLYSDSTTEYDDDLSERMTVLTVNSATSITVDRAEGEVADGSYAVLPSATVVTVVSRAQNFLEPFPDAITFRGGSIIQHPVRLDSGEITYDLSAVNVKDFEAPNGHYMRDIMYWKNELPLMREDHFINGIKRTGNHLSTPKIPYRTGGAIWAAEQVSTNLIPIDGQFSIFDFSDVFEDLAVNHSDGPGDTAWMSPRMFAIYNEMLFPYKGMFGGDDTTLDMRTTSVKTAFASINPKWANKWPNSKILICSKSDFTYGNVIGMDWTYVERGPEELGFFGQSWTMGGDWVLIPQNITHLRLMTGIDARKDLYPARSEFL